MDHRGKANRFFKEPFCDCIYPKCSRMKKEIDLVNNISCNCNQYDDNQITEWLWELRNGRPGAIISGRNVIFQARGNSGTTTIRGEKPLTQGKIHFWEIRLKKFISGNELMFGIGTDKVDLYRYRFDFVSVLGLNNQSWGYSFNAVKQHNGIFDAYGNRFSQGCIIGICVDLIKGYLQFFLNRRSLGIAYDNIPIESEILLYPMVSTTVSGTMLKLLQSVSYEMNLQLRAFKILQKNSKQFNELQKIYGLKLFLQKLWFLSSPNKYFILLPNGKIEIAKIPNYQHKPNYLEKYADTHILTFFSHEYRAYKNYSFE